MNRRSTSALALLVVVATACGSGTGTVDPVGDSTPETNNATTTASTPQAAPATTAEPVVTSSSEPPTSAEPIDKISPQAVPALTTSTTTPLAPGEFALDPNSARVQATVTDLADRLGVDRADIDIVEARAVTWGDSSLGCPQPGMQYLQRITDGSLVDLRVDGVDYHYRGGDPLTLCEHPSKV